ncbi:MAG: enoyl-CoA hydratase/isomerase family protein [Deltaproteobacteria bacterium]|nr:MAG: enoyl-CoA hydratase/isomerase family protein [Deltaproteobacteria bacterium]
MDYENIKLEKKDHIGIITIDHPPVNAWNLATMEAFASAVEAVEKDREIRVVIITGAGEKCFSAGFDVKDAANSHKISPKGREVWKTIDCFPKPVIAAINGYALGGGLELAMCCHFRMMVDSPEAMLGLTELNLGIIPGWGGTQRLPRLVGRAKALDMMLFSKTVDAQEALNIGLIDQISTPAKLMTDALAFAAKLSERPPLAVSCVLKAVAAGDYEGLDRGLEVEIEGSAVVGKSQDRKEGFAAFLEKRKPIFKGV